MSEIRTVLALILVGLPACAHRHENARAAKIDPAAGYRLDQLEASEDAANASDELFVILAFSGGGTRAASFAYGVMETLRDTKITVGGVERRMLDEVDVISSVSGGSFTAAYYALYGDRLFEDFETRFLKRDIQGALASSALNPKNLLRLPSTRFDRIDLAAELYGRELFADATYADLIARDRRPFLVVNASDMSLGSRFEFTQDQFDLMCSDLASVPIGRAVAASSAFPGLLTPITLRNYGGSCEGGEPEWVQLALDGKEFATRRYREAEIARTYRDSKSRRYAHLIDGGVADNLGLRGPINSITSTDPGWSVLRRVNLETISTLVVIVVNAKTEPDVKWDASGNTPGTASVLGVVASTPMGNYSIETVELLRDIATAWEAESAARADCAELMAGCAREMPAEAPHEVKLIPIVVDFYGVEDPLRRDLLNLPTTFKLEPRQVDMLKKAGREILRNDPAFRTLASGIP